MIPIFSNTLAEQELDAVSEVFKSRWVGKGKQCDAFERELSAYLGINKILLLNSCTSAIYVGLRALGIGPGDEVIISSINFVACASAVVDMGATPIFADVDLKTLNILPKEIERLRSKRTRAVLILHYGGHPCPMDEIRRACGEDVAILEDSATAIASSYKGRACGTLAEAGFWSFDSMKILVMTDGGALYLRDDEAFAKARAYRYFGLSSETTSGVDALAKRKHRWWEYDLVSTSGRFISNDVLAAMGRVQLNKLADFIHRRQQIWDYYQSELADISELQCPPQPLPDTTSSYYLYWIQVEKQRDELAVYLSQNGVYTTFRYYPLHLVKYYQADCCLSNAEYINETTLNIPLHQNLADNEVDKIVGLIKKFFK